MRTAIKTIFLLGIILLACNGLWGCKGGSIARIGNITGPDSLKENAAAEFSITTESGTNVKYAWSCDPAEAGQFENPTSQSAKFTANEVETDTQVQIRVIVSSDQYGPILKTKNLQILDIKTGWVRTWDAEARGLCTDSLGNIYALGELDGFTLGKFSGNNELFWTLTIEGEIESEGDGKAIAIDLSGDIYIVGSFESSVDFNPGNGVADRTSAGESDAFLIKFNSGGEFLWVQTWGGSGDDGCTGVLVDGVGDIYVTGSFSDSVDFDPGVNTYERASNGHADSFVTKFNSAGDFQWVRTWGGSQYDSPKGSLAWDHSGNIYVTGRFSGDVDFDPGPGTDFHNSGAWQGAFLCKFADNGEFHWAKTWGGDGVIDVTGIAGNGSDLFVVGWFSDIQGSGAIDFDPGPGTDIHVTEGREDAFMSKFNSMGDFQWAKTWGGEGALDDAYGIAVDLAGNIYVTGQFRDGIDFDPGAGEEYHPGEWFDAYLSKYDAGGEFQWVRTWGGTGWDYGYDVALDEEGNIFIIGNFMGTVDFDPGPEIENHMAIVFQDGYLLKLRPNGFWHD